jgi:hypothetical protein
MIIDPNIGTILEPRKDKAKSSRIQGSVDEFLAMEARNPRRGFGSTDSTPDRFGGELSSNLRNEIEVRFDVAASESK